MNGWMMGKMNVFPEVASLHSDNIVHGWPATSIMMICEWGALVIDI